MNFIIFSADDWNDQWLKRPHHLARELAKLGNKVYFITFGTGVPDHLLKSLLNFFGLAKPKVFCPEENIIVIDIGFRLPLRSPLFNIYIQPLLFYLNRTLIWRIFRYTYLRFKFSKAIVIVNNLFTFPVDQFKKFISKSSVIDGIIYDCIDAFEFFPGYNKQLIRTTEEKISDLATLVFVSANSLKNRKVFENKQNVFYIPNGVEFSRFTQTNQKRQEDVQNLRNKGYLVIGYTGAIAEWLDFELLVKILNNNANIAVCLIGPYSDYNTKKKLEHYINELKVQYNGRFIYLGPKRYDEMPSYIHSFDICIIPFKIDELIKYVNPLKIYEYLACGKPVLSVYWSELEELSDLVYFIRSSDDSSTVLRKIVNELQDKKLYEKRVQFAKQYDWQIIAKSAYNKILSNFIQ